MPFLRTTYGKVSSALLLCVVVGSSYAMVRSVEQRHTAQLLANIAQTCDANPSVLGYVSGVLGDLHGIGRQRALNLLSGCGKEYGDLSGAAAGAQATVPKVVSGNSTEQSIISAFHTQPGSSAKKK